MRNIHFEPLEMRETLTSWRIDHGMHPETQIELIWKDYYDWQSILVRVKSDPQKWNSELEKLNKIFQIKYKELSDQDRVKET
jgi:hypothetical protein